MIFMQRYVQAIQSIFARNRFDINDLPCYGPPQETVKAFKIRSSQQVCLDKTSLANLGSYTNKHGIEIVLMFLSFLPCLSICPSVHKVPTLQLAVITRHRNSSTAHHRQEERCHRLPSHRYQIEEGAMADDPVLEDFGCDPQGKFEVEEEEGEASVEEQARKKARLSPLHIHRFAPLSFLADAVEETDGSFNVTAVGRPFGKNKEAYARKCYEELVKDIFNSRENFRKQTAPVRAAMLFVVGGSSGI